MAKRLPGPRRVSRNLHNDRLDEGEHSFFLPGVEPVEGGGFDPFGPWVLPDRRPELSAELFRGRGFEHGGSSDDALLEGGEVQPLPRPDHRWKNSVLS
ncbi:hypothetical protein [Arthrobacter sp. USHLN218]|uniref:hypothetical protein n=1 Tax=Arthrobacter sp. USHLN218 TaxID=3081232 RepID=UPI00301B4C1D